MTKVSKENRRSRKNAGPPPKIHFASVAKGIFVAISRTIGSVFGVISRACRTAWIGWDTIIGRAITLVGSLTVLVGLAFFLFVAFFMPPPAGCMKAEISLHSLRKCVFDTNEFHNLQAFKDAHLGQRLTFSSEVSAAYLPREGEKEYAFAAGIWGELNTYAQSLILCQGQLSNDPSGTKYAQYLKSLSRDQPAIVTGEIQDISRSGLKLTSCLVLPRI